MLLNRLLVAIVAIPILIYLVFFGEMSAFLVLESSILIMLLEFYGMMKKNDIQINMRSGVFLSLLIPAIIYFNETEIATNDYLSLTFAAAIIFFIIKRVIKGEIKQSINNISYTLFGVMYVSVLFSHLLLIKSFSYNNINFFGTSINEGRYWLAMTFLISFGSDASAYFIGKAFGKRAIFPKISPKKTIEGAIGSLIFGVLLSIYLKYASYLNLTLSESFFIGLGGSFFAQMGDLGASLFKREFQVKDTGYIMMSHGGLLDRCDSVLFVAPFIYYVVKTVI